jgi:hypothetical protein
VSVRSIGITLFNADVFIFVFVVILEKIDVRERRYYRKKKNNTGMETHYRTNDIKVGARYTFHTKTGKTFRGNIKKIIRHKQCVIKDSGSVIHERETLVIERADSEREKHTCIYIDMDDIKNTENLESILLTDDPILLTTDILVMIDDFV